MEQEQTNQNQAPPAGEEANKSSSSQALVAFGSREAGQFFGKSDNTITKKPVPLTNFFTSLSRQIYSVACGAMHTLILTTNGEVYSFGNNDDGALGRTGNENEPLKVDLEVPVDMISAGDSHSVACNSAHSLVYHWGAYRNTSKGNISKSETPHRIGEDEFKKKKVKRILSGAHHTLALVDGKIYAWGDAEVGILGRMSTSRRKLDQGLKIEGMGVKGVVEEIYTGAYHAFLKKTEKKKNESYTAIYAWGLNNCGQLGIGNTENQHNPVEVTVLRDKNIKSITGGEHHTIVLTEDGEVYSFGKNDDGQCGLGQDFEEKEESEAEEEVEEEQKKTPAKPAKPPAKSTSKKGKGKGKKGGSQKKGENVEEEKAEEKEDTEKKDGEQEKEGEKEKEAEKEKEGEKAAESQEAEPEKKDEEKGAEEAKEAAAEPEKEKTPKTKSNKKKEKEPEPENSEEQKKIVFKSVKKPQKVEIANVDKIFSGSQFNYAITKEQEIYSWGMGTSYVLGNKNEESVYKPTKIEGELIEGKRIVALGLGSGHVIAFGVDKDAKDPELEEEAFAKVEEQGKISRKGTTTGKKGEKKGKGKKGEEEESGEKDVKKNLTASLEEEHEEKEEKNKRGQKKSLKRKASDEGEENGIKKVKKSPTKEQEPAAESKMEEEKPSTEAPKESEGEPVAVKEDTGKMEEEKPAENKEEAKPEEKAVEPAQPVEEEKKVESVDQPQAEGEKKEENKEAANESENKAQEGTA